ncbi:MULTISPECIES: hypothetical protein [Actibacterium]|uniref:Glycosyltransferase RgtA/B/C/D-like domain-containing protein n=1 Tax=Actibacterium naphthalenivorans TaxID=1614693 RepID=A0A840C6E2_9RHOB|nr:MULTISPECIES: hypothetical protein [Actibacterium]ALG89669.1 hypothetical protein TQ29_05045 [Actibacterium sp. EMB200-NS6]MBB4020650.1 hypothetical protein [Actibacterium naphthalenivorans]
MTDDAAAFKLTDPRREALRSGLWYAAALAACLVVLVLNGKPLFYFDTGSYIDQGEAALRQAGLLERRVPGAPGAGHAPGADDTVNGSRSAVFSVVMAALAQGGNLAALTLLNALAVIIAVWLPARIAARLYCPPRPVAALVGLSLIAAATGSLPFYVAYLMPDTFAPVLLLVIATLTVFARDMKPWEVILALLLGVFAVVSHLSHLAIALLLVPVSLVVSPLLARRRWWLPPLLVALIAAGGIAERSLFKVAAATVGDSEVVYNPFLTARLIEDGPGLRFLERNCPDASIATCALYDALSLSDDPWRLTATHIIFEDSRRLGSFKLMTPEDQRAVAQEQVPFFLMVLKALPARTVYAFAHNTMTQVALFRVDMTVPTERMIAKLSGHKGLGPDGFSGGRLTQDTGWLAVVTPIQGMIYSLSFAALLVLVLWPGFATPYLKALAIMLVLGILANAFVCGGISQPATRYGGRVIWLLPMAATLLLMFTETVSVRRLAPLVIEP